MKRLFAMTRGLIYGAGLMYFLDPIQGRGRQRRFRDRLMGYRNEVKDIARTGFKDLSNKSRGLIAETSARFRNEQPIDWVLEERARARLGAIPARTRGMNISAQEGTLILEGDVLRQDLEKIMMAVNSLHGLRGVENRLNVHADAGEISALQTSDEEIRSKMLWSPSTRLFAGVGSLYLLLRGRRGGLLAPVFTLGGLALGSQVLTNKNLRQIFGMQQEGQQGAIHVVKTVNVRASLEDVYRMWRSFPNFSRFMSHIREIRDTGEGRSHWVVTGPAGIPVEFDTMIIDEVPNEMIAWETLPQSTVRHSGRVRFQQITSGTQVNVHMAYTPQAGVIGHAVAAFFGSDPKSAMDQDLQRFKNLMEEGETRAEGQKVRQEDVLEG